MEAGSRLEHMEAALLELAGLNAVLDATEVAQAIRRAGIINSNLELYGYVRKTLLSHGIKLINRLPKRVAMLCRKHAGVDRDFSLPRSVDTAGVRGVEISHTVSQ